jgi:hypothetical protein
VASLFEPDTFRGQTPDFDFVCEQSDTLKGIATMRARLVTAGNNDFTSGMREWVGLGWYQMAGYSLMRAHCCEKAADLRWPFELICPVDAELKKIEQAVGARDRPRVETSLDAYSEQVTCLSRAGQKEVFGQVNPPGAGRPKLDNMLERARLK